jgi:DNA-binding HxlR family transcriptional regulator
MAFRSRQGERKLDQTSNHRHAAQVPSPVSSECDLATERKVDAFVHELIGRVADKWTMIVLEILTQHGTLRFLRMAELVRGISQKMLTQTVRNMERDGLVVRTVYPVVPPKVEYRLTPLGLSLSAAFCGVWKWAEANMDAVEKARVHFDANSPSVLQPRSGHL